MSNIQTAIRLLRVHHWIKNGFVFAPLIFAAKVREPLLLIRVTIACAAFCALSSAVYMMNDIFDREQDRQHPRKRRRPLASGEVSVRTALILAVLLLTAVFLVTISVFAYDVLELKADTWAVTFVLLTYLGINVLYSRLLKHLVILDVFAISSGFVLRVMAGGFAAGVTNSPWMIICTILLSLFLGFSKRRHELLLLGENSADHRGILKEYSTDLLDRLIGIVTACTVVAYMMYTIDDQTVAKIGSTNLLYTVVFVLYGIFRYLYLVYHKEEGGSPTQIMLSDMPLIINVLLWGVSGGLIVAIGHAGG